MTNETQSESHLDARAKELLNIFDVEGVPNHSGCVASTPNTMKNDSETSLLDSVTQAMDAARAAKAALDTAKNELEKQLEAVMGRLVRPGMAIQRKQRGSPIWLARVRTMRGNDRGTNTFLIQSAPKVKANPGNPEMSTWSVEATPISETTGKHMKGSAHGANANHDTVLLVGDMYLDLVTDDVDQTTTSFMKVVSSAEAQA